MSQGKAGEVRELAIETIRRDSGAQCRPKLSEEHVEELTEALERGDVLPPVVVFFDGQEYWMGGGDHRIEAYLRSGRQTISADVRQGTQQDAEFYGTGDNTDHGLVRSRATKRNAVVKLLTKWPHMSVSAVARHAKVSRPFVHQVMSDTPELKSRLQTSGDEKPEYTHPRSGQLTRMDTKNLHFQSRQSASSIPVNVYRYDPESDTDSIEEIVLRQTGIAWDSPEFAAQFPLSVLTDVGVVLDGQLEYTGCHAAISSEGSQDSAQQYIIGIAPDDCEGLFLVKVYEQDATGGAFTQEGVPAHMLVFVLNGIGVTPEALKSFHWKGEAKGSTAEGIRSLLNLTLRVGRGLHAIHQYDQEALTPWWQANLPMLNQEAVELMLETIKIGEQHNYCFEWGNMADWCKMVRLASRAWKLTDFGLMIPVFDFICMQGERTTQAHLKPEAQAH